MDSLRAAVPLARALLSLGDAERSGVLHVHAGYRRVEVEALRGKLIAVRGIDGEPLGDTLLREGSLDASRHGAALSEAEPEGPVGDWLVAVGAASREAVDRALALQLSLRLGQLLRFPCVTLRFIDHAVAAEGAENDVVRVAMAPCVWDGMLSLAGMLTHAELSQLTGSGALRLTRAGSQLVSQLVPMAKLPRLESVLSGDCGSSHARAVLKVLGAAFDARMDSNSFSLLLRKQREIRRQASAATLLDLPPHSATPDQARRALRRLAQKLHPDRFSAELPALRAVSADVMRALFRAEETLRYPVPRQASR